MPFLEWKPELSVHVPEIDLQHARWIEIANQLHGAMVSGAGPAGVSKALEELLAYARHHFVFEETALARAGYPALDEHRKQHRAMLGEVAVYVERADYGTPISSLQHMTFLRDWIFNHILRTDMAYSAHLVATTQDEAPAHSRT